MDLFSFGVWPVVVYLAACLCVGLWWGRRNKNIRDFSVGGRNYSTIIMVSTTAATLIGGRSCIGLVGHVYEHGVVFLALFLGASFSNYIEAIVFLPRMERFLGMSSPGEIMEVYFGKEGRVTLGVAGAILCLGMLSSQITAMGYLLNYFYDISFEVGAVIGFGVCIIYTAVGGVRAVVATDALQFSVLFLIIPFFAAKIFQAVGGWGGLVNVSPPGHFSPVSFNLDLLPYFVALFFMEYLPCLSPEVLQRFLMSRDVKQMQRSQKTTAILQVPFFVIMTGMGLAAAAGHRQVK